MRNLAYPIALSIAVLSIQASAGWMNASNGLTGSVPALTALVIDRSTGSTFYALTSTNCVFKSTDTGTSWKALGNIAEVSVLALGPTSASTIYAGTSGGVFKSTDGGNNWASLGLVGTPISVLAIDPLTPSTLYAGGNGNVYKSTNRGGSWTELNLGAAPGTEGLWIAGLALDPSTPSTLYVALGMGAGGNLLKSMDGGESWNVIYAKAGPFYNTSSNLVIDPSTPSTLYRINPLKKSTDGGMSWTGLAEPIVNGDIAALAVDPRNSNTLYLSTQITNTEHAIFKSTDGGQSWNAVDTIIPATQSFSFSPDATTIYASTHSGVFKSTDGGLNWGEAKTGLNVLDIELLVVDSADTVYAGGNDGMFKSLDGGGSWSPFYAPVPSAVSSLLFDPTNPNVLYLATNGCYFANNVNLFKSTDGGVVWGNIIPYSPASGCAAVTEVVALDPIHPNTLYLPFGDDYDGFTLIKTTDDGVNWTNLGAAGLGAASEINALVIDPHTPTTLYVATDVGVFRSMDGGASFVPAGFTNTTVALLTIDPIRSNVLYAATSNNSYPPGLGLYKSIDGGASWTPINQGLGGIVAAHPPVNALLVDADRTDVLYLATSGYGVFKSADGGATWAAFNDGLTFLDVRSLALSRRDPAAHRGSRPGVFSPNALYAGTPGGVFKIQ